MKIRNVVAFTAALLMLAACGQADEQEASGADSHSEAGANAPEDAGHIEVSAERAAAAGIEVATAGPASIREVLSLYGTIQPNGERVREVTARYPGVVLNVTRKVGDAVRKGDVLATVESNESLRTYQVVAPLAGVVTARSANAGENAADTPLFTVADLSSVWVELALFPRDVSRVRVGQPVRVTSVDGGLKAEGRVAYVAALGQTATQTMTARVVLDNTKRQWAPGLYVTGEVALAQAEVPLAVRSSAIQTVEGRPTVFVQEGDGFVARPIDAGRADSEHTEVRSGIDPGTAYAATNSFVLKSEAGKGEAGHDH